VAILDLLMPGMNGWELARKLRDQAAGKRPFLIAMTGCATEENRRRSREAGIDLHLLKPTDPALVVGVLERFARLVAPDPAQRATPEAEAAWVLPGCDRAT
jgi:CheY-like chemotaxis protein